MDRVLQHYNYVMPEQNSGAVVELVYHFAMVCIGMAVRTNSQLNRTIHYLRNCWCRVLSVDILCYHSFKLMLS